MTHLSDHHQACLQFLQDIFEVSAALGTRTYIWGGMVTDILCGEFHRAHHDIDGFTLNLLSVKTEMAAMFCEREYTTSYSNEYDFLRVQKGDLHAVFNRLEIDGDLAMWRHVGDWGTVFFPVDWLDPAPRCFCDVHTHISGARFEYAIKTHMRLLNPEWQPRDKDRAAIRVLRAELERNGYDEAEVLSQIWSDTPYWARRGYPEYARPIVAGPAGSDSQG